MLKSTSRNAVLYTVRELGHRAGASSEWMATWRVSFRQGGVTLYPLPDSGARIEFPFDASKPTRCKELLHGPATRHTWMHAPGHEILGLVPEFIVLFNEGSTGTPLFTDRGHGVIECNADILTATLWTLSRLEESLPGPSDEHGRFPAMAAAAFRCGCVERAIVDEYAMGFAQALRALAPQWRPTAADFRVKISHDIDLVGFPRSLRSTIGHLYPRRIPRAFLRDSLSLLGIGSPAYLTAVVETAAISQGRGLDSAFYWKASPRTARDSGYHPEHPQIRAVIDSLAQQGFEMGVHPGYDTFGSVERLQQEVAILRRLVGSAPMGGRQHFLRWRPSTWALWERCGLAYDSSVGFADSIGFRAGTAIPYHPYLLEEDRESTLLEIPLVVMDCTGAEYMRLGVEETLERTTLLVRRCQLMGGVFTLLWHNSSVIERPYAALYPRILDLFPSQARYRWEDDLAIAPAPTLAC